MAASISPFDGPRMLRGDELFASKELAQICFGGPEIIEDEVTASYIPPERGGIFVVAQQGRLVSQIGVVHDQIKMDAAAIRAASIGGVCTHPDYRSQGLAGCLLEYCTAQLVQEKARLMLISGDGELYTRLGNVLHGRYIYFSMTPKTSPAFGPAPADLVLRRMTSADTLPVSQLYRAEPVHFIRQAVDFWLALNDPMRNTYVYADQWIVERSGQAVAYLLLGSPWEQALGAGIRHVGEYAGSRSALVYALQALFAAGDLQELSWPVPWQDSELIQLLQDANCSGSLAPLDGHTLRIVDFAGFMSDLRPILRARLDANLLRGLRFKQSGQWLGGTGDDIYSIVRGKDRLDLDGAAMTRLVMGTAERDSEPIRLPGALAEVIPALFPLPSFLPGINYY